MGNLTIHNLSDRTRTKLEAQARASGRSLEAHIQALLNRAAGVCPEAEAKPFPHDLIALVEPGEDIEPHIEAQDQTQPSIEL